MRRALLLLLALFLLTWAGTASAADTSTEKREAAEAALAAAQRLSSGRGIRTGRELTPALIEVARRRGALSRGDRVEADSLLGRPTDPQDKLQTGGPYTAPAVKSCGLQFCVHWVETTDDAPSLVDGADADAVPDYVNKVMEAAEHSYATEVGGLGWQPPVSDGALGGGDGLTDIYIKELNPGPEDGLYGYANTDPPQTTRSQYGFLVVDDDYSLQDFPRYDGNPDKPLQVTLAHEFNHVLQFGYDMAQDGWMYESTATWAEEKVFPAVDDYIAVYLPGWNARPRQPITESANGKEYGSAVWNHWLEGKFGATVIRDAWAGSDTPENTVQGGGFAPKAYDAAIRDHAGPDFSVALGEFSAATASWEVPGTGFEEGHEYGDVDREDVPLTPDGLLRSTTLDHTGFALYDVPVPAGNVGRLDLAVALPGGTAGTFALVGVDGAAVTRDSESLASGGGGTVSLPDPSSFGRITAVLVNTDVEHAGYDFDCGDWNWSRDDQTVRFQLSSHAAVDPLATAPPAPAAVTTSRDCTDEMPPTATPTPSPSPPAMPTVTPTVTPTPTPATSLRLSRSTTRIRSVLRTGRLAVFARSNKSGRLAAASSVDRRTARRLRVGRRTTSIGTGRRTLSAPGRFKVNVRLTRKARAALKRHRRRSVRIKVVVTFAPADGTRAVRRTLSVLLRP